MSLFAAFMVSKSADRGMVAALEQFAIAHVPATGRSAFTKVEATIAADAHIKEARLPEVDSWLAQHHN